MAIHYKFVKLAHTDQSDFDILEQYIDAADIVFPETACETEISLAAREEKYRRLLKKPKLKEQEIALLEKQISENNNRNSLFPYMTLRAILKKDKVLSCLEREDIAETVPSSISQKHAWLGPLGRGNAEEVIKLFYSDCVSEVSHINSRDRTIARNAGTIEVRIRKLYPELESKKKLEGVVPIGAAHAPERYMKGFQKSILTYEVITLDESIRRNVTWRTELIRQMRDDELKKPYEDYSSQIARALLQISIGIAQMDLPFVNSRRITSIPRRYLTADMGVDDLYTLCEKIKPAQGKSDKIQEIITNFFTEIGKPFPRTEEEYIAVYKQYRQN